MDVPQRAGVVLLEEVGPALLEEGVEPVLGVHVDVVPALNRGVVVPRRVVDARELEPREVRHAVLVLDALDALLDGPEHLAERVHRGLRAVRVHVRDALEELRLHVVARGALHLAEQRDGLVVVAVAVLAPTHEVEELVVQVAALGVVELVQVLGRVATDAAHDVGGLGELRRELREPLERRAEVQVRLAALHDLVKDREGRLVEAQVVQALTEVELRLLLVRRRVLGLALDHALELHRGLLVALLLVEPQRVGEGLAGRTLRGRRLGLRGQLGVVKPLRLLLLRGRGAQGHSPAERRDAYACQPLRDPPSHHRRPCSSAISARVRDPAQRLCEPISARSRP